MASDAFFIQNAMEIFPVILKFVLSVALTLSSTPSKLNAPADIPVVQVGPFARVPVFACPEESAADVPLRSSSFQCKTKFSSPGRFHIKLALMV